jgi:UDP-N-acetylglucosamine--N-acetylmuramyl-(pentapeptide) pyrophosphoryl-undecaprenol N-acetylglucosamine transferase
VKNTKDTEGTAPSSSTVIWIVAAGTGGHIFPGIALAKEIKFKVPNAQITFFGTNERLEEKLVPKHGFPIVFLQAKQWKGKGALDRIRSLWSLVKSTISVWRLIPDNRPNALISVGGYVSMPVGLACWLRGVPIFVLEPNIRAGISNCILSRLAVKAFTVKGSDALNKFHCPTLETGNPVLGVFKINSIRPQAKNILVLGGSQGARVLCHVGLNAYSRLKNRGDELNIILQSGEKNLADAMELKNSLKLGANCEVIPFIHDIAEKLAWADVVVARAGAMTLTELSLTQIPSILVPFPHAADDHQRVNAALWAQAGAAILVDEKEKDFEKKLEDQIHNLTSASNSYEHRKKMSDNLGAFARPNAAEQIVKEILTQL